MIPEKKLEFSRSNSMANDNESDLCQVYGGKNTVLLLSYHTVRKLCNAAYCELLHQLWTFFLSLACNRNRSRSSSTCKTKSYRLKNEDDDDLSENSSSVVVSVESLVRFYVMAKSRPPTEKVLYFVSSIWGDALSIFSDFNARQQHNLPVKVLCNCGWRERDSPHPEIDAASRLEIRICSDIYKKKCWAKIGQLWTLASKIAYYDVFDNFDNIVNRYFFVSSRLAFILTFGRWIHKELWYGSSQKKYTSTKGFIIPQVLLFRDTFSWQILWNILRLTCQSA